MPKAVPTDPGCEKLAPLVTTAEKHAICSCVEFEKIRRMASPSKSGMVRAIGIIPATSDGATGMIPLATIGTEAFKGHRLNIFASQGLNVKLKRFSPYA